MELNKTRITLQNIRNDLDLLEWNTALARAEIKYKENYINGLSLYYRKTMCSWWREIGDSIIDYLERNPQLEELLKKNYLKK